MKSEESHSNKTIFRIILAALAVLLFCGAAVGAAGATEPESELPDTISDETDLVLGLVGIYKQDPPSITITADQDIQMGDWITPEIISSKTRYPEELRNAVIQEIFVRFEIPFLHVLGPDDLIPKGTTIVKTGDDAYTIAVPPSATLKLIAGIATIINGKSIKITLGDSSTVELAGTVEAGSSLTVPTTGVIIPDGKKIDADAKVTITGDTTTTYYGALADAMKAVAEVSGTPAAVIMLRDVTLTESLTVAGTCTLDLNGHVLSRSSEDGTPDFSVITIESDGDLTLIDSSSGKTGKITGGSADNGGGVNVAGNGKFTMNGGEITGNIAMLEGGGVYICGSGTFTMNSGKITKNSVADGLNGGGVCVGSGGTFDMTGGEITENGAYSFGGGVYVADNGTFTMTSGEITKNTAGVGGGVYVADNGTFDMTSGEITENGAYSFGGGVYVADNGTFTMTGGEITENSAYSFGGGVYVGGTFEVSGDSYIRNNTKGTGDNAPANNVVLVDREGETGLILTGDLKGYIRITDILNKSIKPGAKFGEAEDGASNAAKITADGTNLFGKIMDGALIWAEPKRSSSGSQGTSIWLTATPTPTPALTPTPAPTVTQAPDVPMVKPITTPSPASPAPFAGILAGLGAAALLIALRRK